MKSTSSYRILGLTEDYIERLKEHKERQKELAKINNIKWSEKHFVFTTIRYKGYIAQYTGIKFKKIMNKLKIKNYEDLSTHNMRHSFISRGLENGIGVDKMQKMAGHADINTTIKVYTHLSKQIIADSVNEVNKDFAGLLKK